MTRFFAVCTAAICLFAQPAPAVAQDAPDEITAETSAPAPATDAVDSDVSVAPERPMPGASELTDVEDFGALDLAALLDADVETASRGRKEPVSKAPAIIEVMTREQLYGLGARDLYTALTFLPGVEIIQSYMGYPTFIFRGQLQEIYNAKILLLINGHPSYEVVNSSFYLEAIPLEAIDRIEVIRGPGSVLYGTNAFAGVINIITAQQQKQGTTTDVRAEGGSFTTFGGGAGNRGRAGDLQWAVYAGGERTNGYPYPIRKSQNEDCFLPPAEQYRPADCAGPGPSTTLDYFNNYASGFGDLQYKGLRLQFGGLQQKRQKYAIVPVVRYTGHNEFTHYWADLSYRHEWETLTVTLRGGYDEDSRIWEFGRFPYPGPQFPVDSYADNNSMLYRAEGLVTWLPVKQVQLDQGVVYELSAADYFDILFTNGSLHPLAPRFDRMPEQTSVSYFAQGTWRVMDNLSLVAGNRTTWFETDRLHVMLAPGGTVPEQTVVTDDPVVINSPRAGIVYAPLDELVVKALYGSAFRVPNHFETSAVFNQVIGVTEGLRPETIRTAELAIDSRPIERMSLRVNAYQSLTDRLIARRRPTAQEAVIFGETATVYDNGPGERIRGVELATRTIVSEELSFFVNADYKVGRNRVTDNDVTDISDITASGGIAYSPVGLLGIKPNAQYFGRRGEAGGYVLTNAVIDLQVADGVTVSLIGNNLFDRKYLYPEYVRTIITTLPGGPGRAFYGRVVAQF